MEKLVAALGPAFAAGFAVQRLLEILDPIVNRVAGETHKKTVAGIVSLVFGLAAAFIAGLRVLGPLGVASGRGIDALDAVVTGLIISAGTEGFNSLMKFLTYKKEEKKAQAVTRKLDAVDAAALGGRERTSRLGASRRLEQLALSPLTARPRAAAPGQILKPGVSVEKGLELALKESILARWRDKVIDGDWLTTPFGDYTSDADDPPVVVLEATERVAGELNATLSDDLVSDLQKRSKLDTTPEGILPRMLHVLEWSS